MLMPRTNFQAAISKVLTAPCVADYAGKSVSLAQISIKFAHMLTG